MNILLVGNGFDLAHGLKTKYEHFLYLIKNWRSFYEEYEQWRKDGIIPEKSILGMYVSKEDAIDDDNIKKLDESICKNSWIGYYCRCEAEIDGWIDFEIEMKPVMELFEFVLHAPYCMKLVGPNENSLESHINKSEFEGKLLRTSALWERYFNTMQSSNSVGVREYLCSPQYGILKKKIIHLLREEFDDFIKAFEIYLVEFVHKKKEVKALHQIKKLKIDKMISLNYTLTEKIYGIEEQDVHHIHGMIRDDIHYVENENSESYNRFNHREVASRKNNMVVGVNEQENQNLDFIYFVKYFQRIQKGAGVAYKKFVDAAHEMSVDAEISEAYKLYIYGHSLDETDEDILRYLIGEIKEGGYFMMKPRKVIIFYYNPADYEQKVINLIKLYGRSIVEKYMEAGMFVFAQTSSTVWEEEV